MKSLHRFWRNSTFTSKPRCWLSRSCNRILRIIGYKRVRYINLKI